MIITTAFIVNTVLTILKEKMVSEVREEINGAFSNYIDGTEHILVFKKLIPDIAELLVEYDIVDFTLDSDENQVILTFKDQIANITEFYNELNKTGIEFTKI